MISLYSNIFNLFLDAYSYPLKVTEFFKQQLDKYEIETKQGINPSIYLEKLISELEVLTKNNAENYFENGKALEESLNKVDDYTKTFENIIVKNQIKERFYPQTGDNYEIKTIKLFKRILQHIIWFEIKLENKIRKYRNKDLKPIHYKNHRLKKQELSQYVFINLFLEKIENTYQNTLLNRQLILVNIEKIEKQICLELILKKKLNLNEIRNSLYAIEKEIEKQKISIKENISNIEKELNEKFENLQLKYGTFEFPSTKTRAKKSISNRRKYFTRFSTLFYSYKLGLQTLISYSEFEFNIHKALNKSTQISNNSIKEIQKDFETIVIQKINSIIFEITNELDKNHKDKTINNKILTDKVLKIQIPNLKNDIVSLEIISKIENTENQIFDLISNLNTIFNIPYSGYFNKALNKKDIRQVNTQIVIQGIYEKYIKLKFAYEKREIISLIQKALFKLTEISEVLEYSIDYYELSNKNNQNTSDFIDGIKRALSKCNDFVEFIYETKKVISNEIENININHIKAQSFAVEAHNITIYIKKQNRINRINQIKGNFKTIIEFTKKIGLVIKTSVLTAHSLLKKQYLSLQVLFGINKSAMTISNHLRNYLSETDSTINKLPLMYQKLFRTDPLISEKFYIPRNKISQQLKEAYSEWNKKRFATVCLTGETGSGLTTILNFFEKEISNKIPIKHIIIETQITTEVEFLKLIHNIFPNLAFDSLSDLKEKIANKSSKDIIFIENIHYLFARYNNGFKYIKFFLELITLSHYSTFWICTAKVYSWKYLNYTIEINNYFAYTIPLIPLNQEQLIKIIFQRHLPSGYNIEYIPRDNFKQNSKFKRLDKETQKKILEKDFFEKLYKLTQGNIKLALLFWQTNIKKIENETFYLKLKEIDHSFLNSMDIQNIKILHNILIHDGLTINEYSKIFKTQIVQSENQLNVLKNKAILIQTKDQYNINPLLYRQIVNHLKGTNFIH